MSHITDHLIHLFITSTHPVNNRFLSKNLQLCNMTKWINYLQIRSDSCVWNLLAKSGLFPDVNTGHPPSVRSVTYLPNAVWYYLLTGNSGRWPTIVWGLFFMIKTARWVKQTLEFIYREISHSVTHSDYTRPLYSLWKGVIRDAVSDLNQCQLVSRFVRRTLASFSLLCSCSSFLRNI